MYPETSHVGMLCAHIRNDSRITVWHISLYTCLIDLWIESDFQRQIIVSRKILMAKAHFRSTTTYHKCLNQLVEHGYIIYRPTYDSYTGSKIEILPKKG
ncbi:hypothetical protein ABIB39_004111 [Mucilaginibacter sp. UYP27]